MNWSKSKTPIYRQQTKVKKVTTINKEPFLLTPDKTTRRNWISCENWDNVAGFIKNN
jgi:hypothetical protein